MTVKRWLWTRLGVAIPLAIVEAVGIYLLVVPVVVWRIYQSEMPHHELAPPNISHGAGSTDIAYLSMTYDCSQGDVVIRGDAPDARYWMVGLYDRWGRALDGAHHNNHTLSVDAQGQFEVRLTASHDGAEGELDCSRSPRGLFMYRVLLPQDPITTPRVHTASTLEEGR